MILQEASSKPEAFGSNLFQLSSQKACSDDIVSHAVGKQTPFDQSVQSAVTAAMQEEGFSSSPMTEQGFTADIHHNESIPANEGKCATPLSQNIAVSESDDIVDSIRLFQGRETTHSAQSVKLDEGSVSEHSTVEHIVPAESVPLAVPVDQRICEADSKLTTKDEAVQHQSETKLLVSGSESGHESTVSVKDVSEEHAIVGQGDQLRDERRERGSTEESVPQKFEEQLSDLALTEKIAPAEVSGQSYCDGDVKTAAVQTVSFAVCSDEPSVQNLEVQPLYMPVLSDLTSTADIGEIRHEDVCLPETLDIAAQPIVEARVESDEFSRAESETDLTSVMWKYRADDGCMDSSDLVERMPAMDADFGDEQNRARRLREEDSPTRTHVSLAETKSRTLDVEYERHRTDSEDEEDVEASDVWCVVEKERDAGFDVKLTEAATAKTHEQVPVNVGDVSRFAKEFVYDSATDKTSTEHMSTTSCTSKHPS